MKPIVLPLLILCTCLLSGLLNAADEPVDALSKARAAAIQLQFKFEPGSFSFGRGVFISKDGHALVSLASVCLKQEPTVLCAGSVELKFGKILGLFPDHGLALIKFDYRPESWLNIAEKEPGIGDSISLVTMHPEAPWKTLVPPVVGPVMAKRNELKTRLFRIPFFVRVLSLGSGASSDQARSMVEGAFAVDQQGDLVAFGEGSDATNEQTIILLSAVYDLAPHVESTIKAGTEIQHPVPDADNPLDPAMLSAEFTKLMDAANEGDVKSARQKFANLLKSYPDTTNLKLLRWNSTFSDPPLQPALPKESEPRGLRVETLIARSKFSFADGDIENAIRELESAVALSPGNFPRDRTSLARFYLNLGRLDDANRLCREALEGSPESIVLNELLEKVLTRQRKWDELGKIEKRLEHLYEVYQR